jgi:hypothetical protein
MSRSRHISSTLAFVFAFAIAPLFLQHCVMADAVLPRVFACEEERPVEPPCHDSGDDAPVEMCCAGAEATLVEDAVTLDRTVLPAPSVAVALLPSAPLPGRTQVNAYDNSDTLPPPARGPRLSVLLCTFLC